MSSNESLEGLMKLAADCSGDNWDGYGASAVPAGAVATAARLIQALPRGLPAPNPGAESDGCVTLEWYVSTSRLLSISAAPDGQLTYVAFLGEQKQKGSCVFGDEFPIIIHSLIAQICSVEPARN